MKKPMSCYAACGVLFGATSCRWSTPDVGGGPVRHATIQTAGYAGVVAAGLGFDSGRWSHDALVGYVPAGIGGEDLWSLTGRTSYGLHRTYHHTTDYRAYLSLSLHCSFDDDTFYFLPDQYPDGYYLPTAVRASLGLRLEANGDRHGVYCEIGALDIAVVAKLRNWNTLGWGEAVTLGIGYRYRGIGRESLPQESTTHLPSRSGVCPGGCDYPRPVARGEGDCPRTF